MTSLSLVSTLILASSLALAQNGGDEFHHHNFDVSVGPAIPLGNATNYLNTAPFVGFGYGYRLNRLFQADAGFQIAFGAANNQNIVLTDAGTLQGGDHEYMIPLGGRIIIPQPFHRVEVSAGGGTVYLHYSETAPSGGGTMARLPATVAHRAEVGADMAWQTSATSSIRITLSGLERRCSTLRVPQAARQSPTFQPLTRRTTGLVWVSSSDLASECKLLRREHTPKLDLIVHPIQRKAETGVVLSLVFPARPCAIKRRVNTQQDPPRDRSLALPIRRSLWEQNC